MNKLTSTILLVEDNEDDVFVMKRALKKAEVSYPIALAQDGQQAVDYLSGAGPFQDRAKHPLPWLLFLDLKLPYLTGFEVLTWIRSQSQLDKLVVVMLTSSGEEKDQQRAYALGARSYLIKPPTPETLLSVIQSLRVGGRVFE